MSQQSNCKHMFNLPTNLKVLNPSSLQHTAELSLEPAFCFTDVKESCFFLQPNIEGLEPILGDYDYYILNKGVVVPKGHN